MSSSDVSAALAAAVARSDAATAAAVSAPVEAAVSAPVEALPVPVQVPVPVPVPVSSGHAPGSATLRSVSVPTALPKVAPALAPAPAPAAVSASGLSGAGMARSATRDVVAMLTQRVLAIAVEELRGDQTRRYVSENLVVPLLRAVMAECAPYIIGFASVIAAILLMSALTLTLSTLFYLRVGGGVGAALRRAPLMALA